MARLLTVKPGARIFFVKSQIVNLLGFVGCRVSSAVSQVCCSTRKQPRTTCKQTATHVRGRLPRPATAMVCHLLGNGVRGGLGRCRQRRRAHVWGGRPCGKVRQRVLRRPAPPPTAWCQHTLLSLSRWQCLGTMNYFTRAHYFKYALSNFQRLMWTRNILSSFFFRICFLNENRVINSS